MSRPTLAVVLMLALGGPSALQAVPPTTTQRPTAKPAPRPTAKPPARPGTRAAAVAPRQEAATITCPESLGTGVRTGVEYCFVLAGLDPSGGVLVTLPPRTGDATLRFDLHNRHTYSEEQMKAGRGFASYTAVIGILTLDGELLDRAAIRTEFRTAADVHERITGGAGPGGVKAVAPVGVEPVAVTIPAGIDRVSLLGEVLDATTAAGREMAAPGRPVAIVSNVTVEYRPRK
jgi:hypothetical protein